jgi:CheY-like chemotaxis protein
MSKKKILFVDDDPDIQEIVAFILEEENIELIKAVSAPPVAKIAEVQPDLILLDEWLPDQTGSALCAELKKTRRTAHIPVILISAVCGLGTIADQCHADAFINKPFDLSDLTRVIGNYLAASNSLV